MGLEAPCGKRTNECTRPEGGGILNFVGALHSFGFGLAQIHTYITRYDLRIRIGQHTRNGATQTGHAERLQTKTYLCITSTCNRVQIYWRNSIRIQMVPSNYREKMADDCLCDTGVFFPFFPLPFKSPQCLCMYDWQRTFREILIHSVITLFLIALYLVHYSCF